MSREDLKQQVVMKVVSEMAAHRMLERAGELVGKAHRNLAEAEDLLALMVEVSDEDVIDKSWWDRKIDFLRRNRKILDALYNSLEEQTEQDERKRMFSILYTSRFADVIEQIRAEVPPRTA